MTRYEYLLKLIKNTEDINLLIFYNNVRNNMSIENAEKTI